MSLHPTADTTDDLADLSDDALFERAATIVAQPTQDAADSFRLHAPLELLARRALLDRVDPARRGLARDRIMWVADTYARSGAPLAGAWDPQPEPDRDAVVASLAAAGHASIYFSLLPHAAPDSPAAAAMLQPLARELSRYPDWNVQWVDAESPTADDADGDGDAHTLERALLATPKLGLPGSDFIFPIVHQVDAGGVAENVIRPVLGRGRDLAGAANAIARVAAWSMLQDDPAHAPYGWTHCLTLPQAICRISTTTRNPGRALAIAATHVVGFRAALSNTTVVDRYEPEPVSVSALAALDTSPQTAGAAVWHAPASAIPAITTELATRAALHHDAHVVKYTLACFDAAHDDPEHARLFLSAAAYLHGWWARAGA